MMNKFQQFTFFLISLLHSPSFEQIDCRSLFYLLIINQSKHSVLHPRMAPMRCIAKHHLGNETVIVQSLKSRSNCVGVEEDKSS